MCSITYKQYINELKNENVNEKGKRAEYKIHCVCHEKFLK